jgi:hypothetical protein
MRHLTSNSEANREARAEIMEQCGGVGGITVHTTNYFLKELAKPGIAAKFIASDLPVEVLRLSLEGKDLLRVLNTAAPNKFLNQPAIVAKWQAVFHVRRSSQTTHEIAAVATGALHTMK